MEDLIYILFVIVAIVSSVASNSKRQRAAREAAEAQEEEAEFEQVHDEAESMAPTQPTQPLQPVQPTPHRASAADTAMRGEGRTMQQGSTIHPDSQESITSEIAIARNQAGRASHNRPTPHTAPNSHSATHRAPNSNPEEKHPLIADFDAKKGIIWAEILKPKFEEE